MFIRKITICNLLVYYGEVSVEFKKQEGKNLYCIYADNSLGKTSFIRCAKLLFLGTGTQSESIPPVIARFAPKEKIIKKFIIGDSVNWKGIVNKSALSEGKQDFFVRFSGEIEGSEFVIERAWKGVQEAQIKEELKFELGDKIYTNDDAQHKLNNILPENFVEFFFFDGEEIEHISDDLRTKLREKIIEILQISPLEIIIKQIRKIRDELIANETKNKEQKNSLEVKKLEQETTEKQIEGKNQSLNDTQTQLEYNAQRIKDLQRKLDKIIADSSAELAELTRTKDEADEALYQQKKNLSDSLKVVVFASNAKLMSDLHNELDTIQASTQQGDIEALKRLIPQMQNLANEKIQTLQYENDTIENFKQIFGDILTQMPSVLEFQLAKEHSLIPLRYTQRIRDMFVRVENSQVAEDIAAIKKIKTELAFIKAQINELNTDESAKIEQEEINDELEQCNKKEKVLKDEFEILKSELEQLKIKKDTLKREIDSLEQSINTERIEHKLRLLDTLSQSINEYKERLISRLRDELHDVILDKYKKIIPNDNIRELEIGDNFEIKLKDKYGEPIVVESQSSGQKQILAICIFWALSELSRSQIPLILDTPLSRIDQTNRINIIKHYYANNNQIILLPTDTEFREKEYEYAKSFIAGLYQISNEQDRSHATIKVIADIKEIL